MKHRRAQAIASILAMVVLWGAVGVLAIRAFDQEQPISGGEYKQQIEALERD